MEKKNAYHIFPLGDAAATIDLGNIVCSSLNQKVLAMQAWIEKHAFEGLKDTIVGYSSLSILYDPVIILRKQKLKTTAYEFVKSILESSFSASLELKSDNGSEIHLPVCYDEMFAPDLASIATSKNFDREDVINIHLSRVYRVYMMGFLPGFAYMGDVDELIQLPRKDKPENVTAGSVGIANAQTGIYPLDSPGGWQIIGRTPVKLFNPQAIQPVKLKSGQFIRFHRISTAEFEEISISQMF